jgi:hypothetical protein
MSWNYAPAKRHFRRRTTSPHRSDEKRLGPRSRIIVNNVVSSERILKWE